MDVEAKQDYWTALRDDPSMANAKRKLSMDELAIRLKAAR